MSGSDIKQVIVVRTDLKMGKGKLATQVAHAAVESFVKALNEKPEIARKWLSQGQKKIVLKVSSLNELLQIYEEALREDLVAVLIRDAGLTQLEPGTVTCVGIGPDYSSKIDKVTGKLKLL